MPPARAPQDVRVYAVGDIHGCARLLEKLHALIRADAAAAPAGRKIIVYLGDYIDRGPESREVVDLVLAGPGDGFERVCLKGNHEDMLLRFLEGGEDSWTWRMNGGAATLRSYGVDPEGTDDDGSRKALAGLMPARHRDFFAALETTHIEGTYLFVHAGLRPGVPIERQSEEDLLWIRGAFLDSPADWGYTVVQGHSAGPELEVRAIRINLDTGAVWTGRLTSMVFHGDRRDALQT
ncbi:MAG: metallophosphoesterase family protein [Rickettsiales bacterium]